MTFKVGDTVRYCGKLPPKGAPDGAWTYREKSLEQTVTAVNAEDGMVASLKTEFTKQCYVDASVFELYSVDLENK